MSNIKFDSAQQYINEYIADALILISDVNRHWYNGVWSDFGFTIITKNKAYVILDSRDYDVAKRTLPKDVEVIKYQKKEDYFNLIKSLKLSSILVESDLLTIHNFNLWIKPLKIKNIKYFESTNLRMVKSNEEIKYLEKSCEIISEAVNHLRTFIKPGVSEIEAANELFKFCVDKGASGLSFNTIVCFGKNSSDIHGVPTNYKYKKGDNILVDAGCIYKGYCSDITRCWGSSNKEIQKMYKVVTEANELGIKTIKANILGSELDKIIRGHVFDNYNNYDYPHGTGHGVGLVIHENPRISKIYHAPLLENSLVTIEPGIYIEGLGGVRIEDTVVITKTGCKVLTKKAIK